MYQINRLLSDDLAKLIDTKWTTPESLCFQEALKIELISAKTTMIVLHNVESIGWLSCLLILDCTHADRQVLRNFADEIPFSERSIHILNTWHQTLQRKQFAKPECPSCTNYSKAQHWEPSAKAGNTFLLNLKAARKIWAWFTSP